MDLTCNYCKLLSKNKAALAAHCKIHIKREDNNKKYQNSPEWLARFNKLVEQNQKTP